MAAQTGSPTGSAKSLGGRKIVGFQFTRSAHSSGSTLFTIFGSMDNGANFAQFNMLISNVANTNSQTITRVASITLGANGTSTCPVDDFVEFTDVYAVAVNTTDGAATVDALVI